MLAFLLVLSIAPRPDVTSSTQAGITIDLGRGTEPVLTLNARFAAAPDELLTSYVHEQWHWHLRDRLPQQQAAIAELRKMYPQAPVGLPAAAENVYSTYGHLVTCYLEILAARELLGTERASAAIKNKGNYTWIYATVLRDEKQIAAVVDRHGLRVK